MTARETYLLGCDVLGADLASPKFVITQVPSTAATATPIVDAAPLFMAPAPTWTQSTLPNDLFTRPPNPRQQAHVAASLRGGMSTGAAVAILTGTALGVALFGTGGALLWPAHRVLGFFLGAVFLGVPIGAPIGAVSAGLIAKQAGA